MKGILLLYIWLCENGQRVYFTELTTLQQAITALKTTLTEFFSLCNRQDVGQFANTLMYTDVPKFFTWNKQKVGNHGSKAFQSQDSRTYL